MYIVTISWFLQTSTGFHNTVQNGTYKNIYGNCYKTMSWKLFEDYGDNLIYMIFVGFIVVGFFFLERLFILCRKFITEGVLITQGKIQLNCICKQFWYIW